MSDDLLQEALRQQTETLEWCKTLTQANGELRERLERVEAERDMLRGVGCLEDGDGPCGVCIKCLKANTERAEGQAAARSDRLRPRVRKEVPMSEHKGNCLTRVTRSGRYPCDCGAAVGEYPVTHPCGCIGTESCTSTLHPGAVDGVRTEAHEAGRRAGLELAERALKDAADRENAVVSPGLAYGAGLVRALIEAERKTT